MKKEIKQLLALCLTLVFFVQLIFGFIPEVKAEETASTEAEAYPITFQCTVEGKQNEGLKGVRFFLYDKDKNLIEDEIYSDALGQFRLRLKEGESYTLEEVEVPEGYEKMDLIHLSVDHDKVKVDGDEEYALNDIVFLENTLEEPQETETLTIHVENPHHRALQGARFFLKDLSVDTQEEDHEESDSNGDLSFELIKGHSYRLSERVAPKGYRVSGTIYQISWDESERLVVRGERNLMISGIHPLVVENEYKEGPSENQQSIEKPSSKPSTSLKPTLNVKERDAYLVGYDSGLIRPESAITRAEAAAVFFRLLTPESRKAHLTHHNSYTDCQEKDWYNTVVSTLSEAKIISGYPDGTFRGNAVISRAEFATIAARFLDKKGENATFFKDVPSHYWAATAISAAVEAGWIKGYPDQMFKPEKDITRAEVCSLINRAVERAVKKSDLLPEMKTWPDNPVSAWYYTDIQEATNTYSYVKTNERVPGQNFDYDKWEKILPNKNWQQYTP